MSSYEAYPSRNYASKVIFLFLLIFMMTMSGLNPINSFSEPKKSFSVVKTLALPDSLENNLADVNAPFGVGDDVFGRVGRKNTPLYWHIPKAGGTSVRDFYRDEECYGFVWAASCPQGAQCLGMTKLKLDSNIPLVDTDSMEGLKHSKSLELVQSGFADIISATRAYDATDILFDPIHQGRMFAIFRHPVERAVSMFYYLQQATWESTYNPMYKDITIHDYARSSVTDDNWMVRSLAGKADSPGAPLTERDLDVALEIVRRKCVVGLLSNMEESVDRFSSYFNFRKRGMQLNVKKNPKCKEYLKSGSNTNSHPPLQEGSETWRLLEQKNGADMILYREAERIFKEQKLLIP
uniref:Sulfotransferase domain-containing protein n=1 Tax=Ditylum brightwellii TaxID=49249 RepID=A0A7S4V8J3_9STRA